MAKACWLSRQRVKGLSVEEKSKNTDSSLGIKTLTFVLKDERSECPFSCQRADTVKIFPLLTEKNFDIRFKG